MPAGTVVSTTKQNIISAYYDVKREDNFVMAAAFRDGNLQIPTNNKYTVASFNGYNQLVVELAFDTLEAATSFFGSNPHQWKVVYNNGKIVAGAAAGFVGAVDNVTEPNFTFSCLIGILTLNKNGRVFSYWSLPSTLQIQIKIHWNCN